MKKRVVSNVKNMQNTETNVPKHGEKIQEKKPDTCQLTINEITVDMVQIVDRLEYFSKIIEAISKRATPKYID